jgi:putative transposase
VLDVYSRRIVGWNSASSMTTDLTLTALNMAVWSRNRPLAGLRALNPVGVATTI